MERRAILIYRAKTLAKAGDEPHGRGDGCPGNKKPLQMYCGIAERTRM